LNEFSDCWGHLCSGVEIAAHCD